MLHTKLVESMTKFLKLKVKKIRSSIAARICHFNVREKSAIASFGNRYSNDICLTDDKTSILVSDYWIPEYDTNAGARCTYQYLQLLVSMGYEVYFLPRNGERKEPYTSNLERFGVKAVFPDNIYYWLEANCAKFDYIYLHRPDSASIIDLVVQKVSTDRIIYFAHDLHHIRLRRQYEVEKNPVLLKEAALVEYSERKMIESATTIHVVGNFEKSVLDAQYVNKKITSIPLFLFEKSELENSNVFRSRCDLVYVGGYNHPPNIDAVEWFLDNVWDKSKLKSEGVKFYIVGNNPPVSFEKRNDSSVVVKGQVSDDELNEIYRRTRIMVVPLRFGAGVKGKVLEAMNAGLPLIVSKIASEGVEDAENSMIIAQDSDWVDLLDKCYYMNDGLFEIALRAKATIEKFYSINSAEKIFCEDLPKRRKK